MAIKIYGIYTDNQVRDHLSLYLFTISVLLLVIEKHLSVGYHIGTENGMFWAA